MIEIYVDGSGKGHFCFFKPNDKPRVGSYHLNGITNNEAEYKAVIAALMSVSDGSEVTILTDSQIVVNQLNLSWNIRSTKLRRLFDMVYEVMDLKDLTVTFKWIPRKKNKAGKYLG